MANLRIVYDNIADIGTTTASSTSGSLTVANLKTDIKGSVHRSTTTNVTFTTTWTAPQKVGCVAIPAANFSSSTTMRVRLFSDEAATTQIYDSGNLLVVSGINYNTNWSGGIDANSFYYGGVIKAAIWITTKPSTVRACKVDILDSANPRGYIDCARLVIGDYWSPTHNFEAGIEYESVDNSNVLRTDSGDLLADRKYQYDTLSFNFALLTESDKNTLSNILKTVGTTRNIFISMVPEYTDKATIQDYMIYGKRESSGYAQPYHKYYSHQMTIQGW